MQIKKIENNELLKINLDNFNRKQKISKIYVKKDNEYVLVEQHGWMDWNIAKKREVANDLLDSNYISYIAFEGPTIIGFVSLVKNMVEGRMILDVIQVDSNYRGQGIGRALWNKAVEEAHANGAKELYISACPSEETINFYKAMGADVTNNPIKEIANDEPEDLQMTYSII